MTRNQLNKFDEFLKLYLDGTDRIGIAKHYGVSLATCDAAMSGMRAIGLIGDEEANYRKANMRNLRHDKKSQMCEAFFESGLTLSQYQKETGVPVSSLRKAIKESDSYQVSDIPRGHSAWKHGNISQEEYDYILKDASVHGGTNRKQMADVVWQLANENKTLAAVGEELGVTRERARQIMVKGARLIRDYRSDGSGTSWVSTDEWQNGLSTRARGILKKIGVTTKDEFLNITTDLLSKTSCCGWKTIFEIDAYQRLMRKENSNE